MLSDGSELGAASELVARSALAAGSVLGAWGLTWAGESELGTGGRAWAAGRCTMRRATGSTKRAAIGPITAMSRT